MMRVDFSKELGWCLKMAKKRFPGLPVSSWTARILSHGDGSFKVELWHSVPRMKAILIGWVRTGDYKKGFVDKKIIKTDYDRKRLFL